MRVLDPRTVVAVGIRGAGAGTRLRRVLLAAVVAALAIVAVPSAVEAGRSGFAATDDGPNDLTFADVRVVARRLDDGRTEFALQRDQRPIWPRAAPDWGDPQLPTLRFFPAGAPAGRWLASSPLEVRVFDEAPGRRHVSGLTEVTVRIVARGLTSGRLEFALQQRRTDDRWGESEFPERRFFPSDAPAGRWLVASPMRVFASYQPKPASPGPFTAIAADDVWGPSDHACALNADGAITCWGTNRFGESDTPDGRFTAVTVGGYDSCGVRTDRSITCWGSLRVVAPDGEFVAVSAGTSQACGIRTDGTVTCWSVYWVSRSLIAPDGQFAAVSTGDFHACGLRADATIECWGYDRDGSTDAPDGQFVAVSSGSAHSCGLRTDGTITCWGSNRNGQTDAPDGQFVAVTADSYDPCGLRTDGTITCWGARYRYAPGPPDGQYTAISGRCALRADGTATCW